MSKLLLYKTRGSALMYAMIFVMVMSTICTGILAVGYRAKTTQINIDHIRRAQLNMQSALQLVQQNESSKSMAKYIDMLPSESVNTSIKPWGMYRFLNILSSSGLYSLRKSFLLGGDHLNDTPILTMPYSRDELRYGQDVVLHGKIRVPKGKLERVYRKSTDRKGKIDAVISKSGLSLPEIGSTSLSVHDTIRPETVYFTALESDSVFRSFQQPTLRIICEPHQLVDNITLYGNIELVGGVIQLIKTAKTDQIHIICNELYIDKKFRGNLHATVKHLAQIEDEVKLLYPSSIRLTINNDIRSSDENRGIIIGENCDISGVLALTQRSGLRNFRDPVVELGNFTKVTGEIYCDGNAILRGDISGSVYAREVSGGNQASTYAHTLMGVSITNDVPSSFVGTLFNTNRNLIASCLN